MKLSKNLASINIGGEYFAIKKGAQKIGNLKINLVFENKAKNLYSWVVYLENDSDENSPRITNFYGLDTTFSLKGDVKFNTLRGDDNSIYSFFPESFDLVDGQTVERIPTGGRSSNTTAFPYFDIEDSTGKGLVFGIGWSGQWKLNAMRDGDNVRLLAGFYDCDFYLEPHEKIRSIRVLLYLGKGGEDKLCHDFVRLQREHYTPIPDFDNKTYFPISPACFSRYYWGNIPKEGEINYFESEDAQLNIINNGSKGKHFNSFWFDACWFEGAFRTGVGNYEYAKGFPNGLKKISDTAKSKGFKFILWFEPVRAMKDTEVYNKFKHDERKIISCETEKHYLVNLGDPEVWQYQFDNIARIIEENDVDVYRQDFNIDPYYFLIEIEKEGRKGIDQIHFVEGIYKLWDALAERFPNLIIDSCASGGRLIDVETNMRSIPLWRSDVSCRPSPLGSQNEILGLSKYIPYHQGATFDYTPYFLRSTTTTGVACEFGFLKGIIDPEKEKTSLNFVSNGNFKVSEIVNVGVLDMDDIDKALDEVIGLREYWKGDFKALTPPSDSKEDIVAFALHLQKQKRGIVLVFRREEAKDKFIVKLPYVLKNKEYKLTFSDEDLVKTEKIVRGEDLINGLEVNFTKTPASLLIYYSQK